jgi:hypothetical protein
MDHYQVDVIGIQLGIQASIPPVVGAVGCSTSDCQRDSVRDSVRDPSGETWSTKVTGRIASEHSVRCCWSRA